MLKVRGENWISQFENWIRIVRNVSFSFDVINGGIINSPDSEMMRKGP